MPTAGQLLGRRAVWLLDLNFGGRVYRFATKAAEVLDEDGEAYQYAIGLRELSHSLAASGPTLSIGIEVDAYVDWALVVAQGVPLERSPGVLRRWFEGTTLEQAQVIVQGLVTRAEYGALDEALTLSLAVLPVEQSNTLPTPTWRAEAGRTWPVAEASMDEKIEGAYYPFVLGRPGLGLFPAVPALMVDFTGMRRQSKVLIAGHPVAATTVNMWDLTDVVATATARPVLQAVDLLNQRISYQDFQMGGAWSQAEDREWFSSWTGDGWIGIDGTPVRGAGHVIQALLQRFTRLALDRGRLAAERTFLDEYLIDTYINDPVDVWTWLQDTVIRLLPVIQLTTSAGLFYKFLNWDAQIQDAVAHLDADLGGVQRTTPVRLTGDPVVNEITVEYGPWAGSQRYTQRVVVTAQAGLVTDAAAIGQDVRIVRDRRAEISQRIYGVKPLRIAASAVWTQSTATRIARDQLRQFALPKRQIGYSGGVELEALEPGSIVTVTDSELYLEDQVALVQDVVVGDGSTVDVDLVLLDHDLTQERITA